MEKISIARALTKRVRTIQDERPQETAPSRALSTRKHDGPINRAQISLPIQLISTTNVLALKAPDIHQSDPASPSSASTASSRSYEDSDASPASSSASSITSADSSRECSPTTVEPNHLSAYFPQSKSKPNAAKSAIDSKTARTSGDSDVPSVPARAMSHTKKTHQTLARQRSRSRSSDPSDGLQIPKVRTSLDIMSNRIEEEHPFGAELAQVKEVAEDFGVQDVRIWGEEEQFLADHGLLRFTADDYITEIKPLFGGLFYDTALSNASWL